jgi:hypothetical protein
MNAAGNFARGAGRGFAAPRAASELTHALGVGYTVRIKSD